MDILPIFFSDASLGRSILTADEPDEIKEDAPVSIWSIVKEHKVNPVVILETSFVNFINHYVQANKLGVQLIFGIKFPIVSDEKDKSEESLKTESSACVFMKNSEGYKDLIKLYSAIHSNPDNQYYYTRGSWKLLNKYLTDNLLLCLPFYSNFISENTLNYGHRAIPELKAEPTFFIENHEMPVDELLTNKIKKFCAENKCEWMNTHTCYYYKDIDARQWQIFKAIHNRSSWEKPEEEFQCQNTFSFESYQRRLNEN